MDTEESLPPVTYGHPVLHSRRSKLFYILFISCSVLVFLVADLATNIGLIALAFVPALNLFLALDRIDKLRRGKNTAKRWLHRAQVLFFGAGLLAIVQTLSDFSGLNFSNNLIPFTGQTLFIWAYFALLGIAAMHAFGMAVLLTYYSSARYHFLRHGYH